MIEIIKIFGQLLVAWFGWWLKKRDDDQKKVEELKGRANEAISSGKEVIRSRVTNVFDRINNFRK